MKKTVFFLLLALSITFANAQNSNEPSSFERSNLRLRESVVDEQGRTVDKETGALRVNRFESFSKPNAKNTEEIVWSFLKERGGIYGLCSDLNNIRISSIQNPPGGKVAFLQQYLNGIPVFSTLFTIGFNRENTITYVLNEFRNVPANREFVSKPLVSSDDALRIARKYLNINGDIMGEPVTELGYFESIDKGLELAWAIDIVTIKPRHAWRIVVSAETGRIIQAMDARTSVTGSGRVFRPNPLVSAGVQYGHNNYFMHNYGANNPSLERQLASVVLRGLIPQDDGVYRLRGEHVIIKDIFQSGYSIPELSSPNEFFFSRDQEEFESVMVYYHIDSSARRILELGFELPDGLLQIEADPHGDLGTRNATYFFPPDNFITFGSSIRDENTFVNAAQDADVIWHEHGHAIQFNLGARFNRDSWMQSHTAAVGEGSADYWATSYKRSLFPNNWEVFAAWFEMDNPFMGRRTDLNLVYPTDFHNTLCNHRRGQIWSSALMRIWGDLGRDITDKLFLRTHFHWGEAPTMRGAATAFMQADVYLHNGVHLCQIYARFQEHGLIDPNNGIVMTSFVNQPPITADRMVVSCSNLIVQDVTITNGAALTLIAPGNIYISNVTIAENSRLILSAGNEVVFDGYFEVHLGAEFEMR